ncbi:hypothetical protein QN357_04245 [Cryobacterium sp. RTC2.1]|uniref:hypothetical protein n=1 Tax=Cryobacterium sp. RTC2.1 TaxID=3048634 RepID=UPI002B236EA0|nr:hypothetical protein [Cryobacterium sp. RTC2.1]MEB0002150.1 hypothetical protein [Cryobacterium sp. RTC2.1]
MITWRLKRAGVRDDDDGVALIAVIGIGAVLLLLVTTMLASSVSGLVKADNDQDWNAAMSAAYAGVEEYQSKLANDNTYQQYGSLATSFSTGSSYTSTDANPAFGIGAGGSWAAVDGSAGRAAYRYEVDNSKYAATGVIRLQATGRVGKITRSVVADLKQQGFIDYLYFTDYEIQDPALSSTSCIPAYGWAVSSRPNCTAIQFGPTDVIAGPVHSNDVLRICGSTFKMRVTTAYQPTTGDRYILPSGCSTPTFAIAKPEFAPVVSMPQTNLLLKQETRSDLTTTGVPRPGCLYTGPTTITFNAAGTMTVRSPWTRKTNVAGDPATSGTVSATCGTPGTVAGSLGSSTGQTISVPANNLVYVQSVPRTSSDPNYWATGTYPSGFTCASASGSSGTSNGLGYPTVNEQAPSSTSSAPSYGCDKGDVFVKGQVHGALTVASDNYVYVVGDITYVDKQADILGLVGQNAVWVWNPVDSRSNLLDPATTGREIDAAILSVGHTFIVQNNDDGLKGVLTVYGSIAQKFRGPVGTAMVSGGVTTLVSGYSKAYAYDPRLRYSAPPKFLSPVSTSYGVTVLVESKTAFNFDGTPR